MPQKAKNGILKSFCLSQGTLDKLDYMVSNRVYPNRTAAIEDAVYNQFLDAQHEIEARTPKTEEAQI